jgi:prevent-host-death family protein
MAQFNVHEAESNLGRLLDLVERGEEVVLAKHGRPVARIVPLDRRGLVLGSENDDSNINREVLAKDDWWKPMTDDEADAFIEGR